MQKTFFFEFQFYNIFLKKLLLYNILFFNLFLTACQDDCEPTPKNQINFRFLQKDTYKPDTLTIKNIIYNDVNKIDTTTRNNFSGFLPLDINASATFTSYTFTGTRKNIPFSYTIVVEYNKNLTKNGSGKCGSIIKIDNLSIQNTNFQETLVKNTTLENDKRNQYDIGLICVQ